MKVTFFYSAIANIGIEYLSAVLKKNGHQCELVFSPLPSSVKIKLGQLLFDSEIEIAKKILKTKPDLIAFSSLSDWHRRNIKLARIIKELNPNIPIIFGGLHVSSVPELVISEPCVDYICVGEGEEALLDLVTAFESKKPTDNIPNIWTKKNNQIIKNPIRPIIKNIDTLPFPDKDLFYGKPPFSFKTEYNIFSERGCPYGCTFCYNSLFKEMYGSTHRRPRSVANVIEELKQAKEKYNIKKTIFLDDTFNFDHDRMADLATQYKQHINQPFMCQVIAKYVTKDSIKVLEETGCRTIAMGIQTVDNNIRQNVLHCPGTRKEIKEAIRIITASKIFLVATIMHTIPFQNDTELKKTSIFLKQNPPDDVFLFKLRYYPRTAITQLAQKHNILSEKDIYDIEQCTKSIPLDYGLSGNDKRLLLLTIMIGKWIPRKILIHILRSDLCNINIPCGNLIKFIQVRIEDIFLIIFPIKRRHAWFSIVREMNYVLYFIKLAVKNIISRILPK